MHKNVKLLINEKGIFYNMWIFPNLPQNVDKIPNSRGPGTRTKKGCDGPDRFLRPCRTSAVKTMSTPMIQKYRR